MSIRSVHTFCLTFLFSRENIHTLSILHFSSICRNHVAAKLHGPLRNVVHAVAFMALIKLVPTRQIFVVSDCAQPTCSFLGC